MEFRVLGPLEVWEDGRPLAITGEKLRAVLAILLLNANRVVATDRLIQLIWGDGPPDTASNALQVYVSQARKRLEPATSRGGSYHRLVSRPPGYLLRVEADELDLNRFDQLVDEGRRLIAADPDRATRKLRQALELWRGPALEDVGDSPFAVGERARLNEKRLRALEERIDADLASGRHWDLVGELQGLVSEQPLRERLCGQLMLALYRSGRQAEASDLYYKTRQHLVNELGMEPSTALQTLLRDILVRAPGVNWVGPEHEAKGANAAALTACPTLRFDSLEIPITLPKSLVGRTSRDKSVRPDVDLSSVDPHRTVSRRHAELLYHDDCLHLRDLGSVNGTTINGHRLEPNESRQLSSGDRLTFGRTSAIYVVTEGFLWRDWLDSTVVEEVQA